MQLRMTAMYRHGVALTCLHICQPVSAQSPFTTASIRYSPAACLGAGTSPLSYFVTAPGPPCHTEVAASVPGSRHVTHTSLHSFLAPPCCRTHRQPHRYLIDRNRYTALSWHCGSAVFFFPHQRWHIEGGRRHSGRTTLRSRIQILGMRPFIPTEEFRSVRQKSCAKYWTTDLKWDNRILTCHGKPAFFDGARLGLPFCKPRDKPWAWGWNIIKWTDSFVKLVWNEALSGYEKESAAEAGSLAVQFQPVNDPSISVVTEKVKWGGASLFRCSWK